jgi:hypothetical protein
MCFVLCHWHLLLTVCKVCFRSKTGFIKKKLLLKFLHFSLIPFKVVSFGGNTPMGAVPPPLEAYYCNFLSLRSFLVLFIALWMLSIVLNYCPHRLFVILGEKKSCVGDI